MKRREFISLLGGATVVWPLAAGAQPAKLPTIGFLGTTTPRNWAVWVAAFQQRLRELGWIEGRTVAIEYRWAEGRPERYTEIAAEFVRLKVDIIVTSGTALPVVKQATSVIPIVFAVATDPVDIGIIASLARPGGNITGLSLQSTDLVGKRLGFLREVVSGLTRLAVMASADYPSAVREMGVVQATARALGIESDMLGIRRAEDIAPAIAALAGRAQAFYVCADALTNTNRVLINTLALAAQLPTVCGERVYVADGGLISYGANTSELFRRAADYVDKILHGAQPGEIPVEQPTKFELVINLKTAATLGLTIPQNLLALADEVIE